VYFATLSVFRVLRKRFYMNYLLYLSHLFVSLTPFGLRVHAIALLLFLDLRRCMNEHKNVKKGKNLWI